MSVKGRWRIVEMELWDEDAIELLVLPSRGGERPSTILTSLASFGTRLESCRMS